MQHAHTTSITNAPAFCPARPRLEPRLQDVSLALAVSESEVSGASSSPVDAVWKKRKAATSARAH
eukprot:12193950-Alexandrium_andersonii.AAC.1